MTPRVKIAIQQIARMRIAGIRDGVIAAKLGMSQSGLSRILALQEYRDEEDAALHGTISKMDEALAGRAEDLKNYARQGIPVALRALVEAVTQQKDLRARISAASELLDRDPDRNFVKGQAKLDANAPAVSEQFLEGLTANADKAATAAAKETIQ